MNFIAVFSPSGNVEAISLGDVYLGVTGTKPQTPALLRKDLSWERLKKTNNSSFIHIYRYVVVVRRCWTHRKPRAIIVVNQLKQVD